MGFVQLHIQTLFSPALFGFREGEKRKERHVIFFHMFLDIVVDIHKDGGVTFSSSSSSFTYWKNPKYGQIFCGGVLLKDKGKWTGEAKAVGLFR